MAVPLFQVDAFTDCAFAGNPAAVCLLDAARDDGWMQQVAAEMNLSETAFTWPEAGEFRLRWFTPLTEVDLCGHATLAAAHALWERGRVPEGAAATFLTRSGRLTASRRDGWIEMDFPALPARPADPPAGMLDALGCPAPVAVAVSRHDFLVEVAGEDVLRSLEPDFAGLKRVATRGVIVTCRGTNGFDFLSRFFCPAVGIDEDPVTGSAHCVLGPHWAARLGETDLVGFQASKRGGTVRVGVAGDRVRLGGHAVTVLRGELLP